MSERNHAWRTVSDEDAVSCTSCGAKMTGEQMAAVRLIATGQTLTMDGMKRAAEGMRIMGRPCR